MTLLCVSKYGSRDAGNSDPDVMWKDIAGMPGARAAAVWVTADGIPTNDNNKESDSFRLIVIPALMQR